MISLWFVCCVVCVCHQVPLIVFKREKKIARRLELERHFGVESDEGRFEQWWDRIVIRSPSFPQQYWDKQVKWRVNNASDYV